VARLSDYGPRDDDVKGEIIDLGLTYELLTAYTSFIAVHEVVRNTSGDAQTVDQPLPLPLGVSDLAVGTPVPEPELPVLFAVCLLTLVLTRRGRRWLTSPWVR
jgi:Ca-activated chloride channel family protein